MKNLPQGVRLGNEQLIQLTESAGDKLSELLSDESEDTVLRVRISGGGCNGLSYKLDFVQDYRRGDILVKSAGSQVVVDCKSALYLRGTTLEYSHALVGGGFRFANPNAKSSCSCGESFNV